jgi:hypothetical protein
MILKPSVWDLAGRNKLNSRYNGKKMGLQWSALLIIRYIHPNRGFNVIVCNRKAIIVSSLDVNVQFKGLL